MPTYTFTDSVPRYYVDLGLEARTGKVYELDHAPDDRFKLVGTDEAKNPNRPTDPNQVLGGVESTKEGGVSIPQGAYVVTGTQGERAVPEPGVVEVNVTDANAPK